MEGNLLSSNYKKKNLDLLASNNSVFDFETINNIYNNNLKKISIKFPLNKITQLQVFLVQENHHY